jgi:CheY-like chemotaxis protein
MHGGTVEAHSPGSGQGSEFVVRLPVAESADDTSASTDGQTQKSIPSGRYRILIVDDNMDAADSLGHLLELMGHEVRTAYDGEAGVVAAAAFRPDVVLMDIGMPKLNGYDAARRIRQESWGKQLILVALTGWGQESDRRRSQEAGFDRHLVKPVDPNALMQLLAETGAATS